MFLTILCFERDWKEEKVKQQSNSRVAWMSYAIGIFSEREHGSGVQEVLLSIS